MYTDHQAGLVNSILVHLDTCPAPAPVLRARVLCTEVHQSRSRPPVNNIMKSGFSNLARIVFLLSNRSFIVQALVRDIFILTIDTDQLIDSYLAHWDIVSTKSTDHETRVSGI